MGAPPRWLRPTTPPWSRHFAWPRPGRSSAIIRPARTGGHEPAFHGRSGVRIVVAVDTRSIGIIVDGHFFDAIAGRAFQGALIQGHHVAVLVRVVPQHGPRYGVTFRAHPHEATEFQYGVANMARALVDHQIIDRSELVAGSVIDRRALDLVRGNHIAA